MKKKLLVFHPIIAPYRIDFFNELSNHYDTNVVLSQRNLKSQSFDYSKIECQMNFSPIYIVKNEIGLFRWIKALWHEIKVVKPDLIVVGEFGLNTIITILYRILFFSKYKIVCITDDSNNILNEDNHFSKRHKLAIKIFAPLIDDFINVEPRSAEWYQQHFRKGYCFPIIVSEKKSINRYQKIIPISETYVEKYNLTGKKVLLFVGRLVALKNIEFAIKAFRKANIDNSVFIIVGSGEQDEYLRHITKGDDNILLVGRFEGDELYAWYNVSQIFTLQSTQEAFGAVTNEALIAGCYSLVSKDAGSNCLIKNGVNGWVIDPHDEDQYILYLKQLMDEVNPLRIPLTVKPNLMNVSFKDCIDSLFSHIDEML